jgi:hypothetical protein
MIWDVRYRISRIRIFILQKSAGSWILNLLMEAKVSSYHRPRIHSPLPLRVAKTGRNNLNEEFTPLLPTGIGERF